MVSLESIALAYIGPDTLLPLGSFLAGLMGILLVFSRSILRFFRRLLRLDRDPAGDKDSIVTDSPPNPPTAI